MPDQLERAALITLLREDKRPPHHYSDLITESGSALSVLDDELGLLARSGLDRTVQELERWERLGIALLTIRDAAYPENLRAAHDRPPLLFLAGALHEADHRAVAVIGARQATRGGLDHARALAHTLVDSGYTVISGLAAGIDTAAHTAALGAGGRTIAVIGTGLNQVYPPQNAQLQERIAAEGAVVSQFWPDASPDRNNFPLRNAVMAGMSLATVIAEASHTSGARIQARQSLAQGRPVFLLNELLEQPWARQLAQRPGTYVIRSASELTAILARLSEPAPLRA